jgi:hypothetical protein
MPIAEEQLSAMRIANKYGSSYLFLAVKVVFAR